MASANLAASLLAFLLFAPGILSSWRSPPPVPASAPASKYVTTSIEQLRVGDWVLARNPEVSEEERDEAGAIVPEQWRRIALRMEKPDGTGLEIELLRPADWLEGGEPQPGDIVWLDLAELGAEGEAEILAVGPCPALGPPPSPDCRVVTGTFAHQSAQVLDLSIEGLDLPLGVTANHPFWSEDRQEFLPAGELRPGAQPVYNIEVDVEHVYYVSQDGVLVHNAYATNRQLIQSIATRAEKWGLRPKRGLAPAGGGRKQGTIKHGYAKKLLERYQKTYGSRGLEAEKSWLGGNRASYGKKGSVRLDVRDVKTGEVYDYKFVGRNSKGLTNSQINKINKEGPPGIPAVHEINP